jgi:hypothetical protein
MIMRHTLVLLAITFSPKRPLAPATEKMYGDEEGLLMATAHVWQAKKLSETFNKFGFCWHCLMATLLANFAVI